MDFNNIYDMLRDGTDPADIAATFTKNLNEAIDKLDKPSEFQLACSNVSEAWHDALDAYVDEYKLDFDASALYANPDVIEELIPIVIFYAQKMSEVKDFVANFGDKTKSKVEGMRQDDTDRVIAAFVNSL